MLREKRAVITGGSRGIGQEISVAFATHGATVIVNYPDLDEEDRAMAVVEQIRSVGGSAYAARADVTVASEVDELMTFAVDRMGGIDILVNNAGVCPWHEFLTMSIETWERAQSINHLGAFLCSQRAANKMIRQGNGGAIITVGSVGAYTGGAMQVHYNASKAAVGSLMRSLAVALGQYGIRCNSILPGCIRTAMNADVLADERVRSDIERRTPLGRLGIPADVVGAAIFFASDLSRFCTGSELRVDGGLSVNI